MKFSFLLLFKPGEALLKGEALGVLAVDVLLEVNLGRGAEEGGAADLADEGEGRGVVLEAGAWFVFELEGGKGVRGGGGGGERWRAKRRRRRRQRRLASFIPFSFFFFALTFAGARRLGQVLGPGDGRLLRVASAHFVKESLELNGRRERERGRKNVSNGFFKAEIFCGTRGGKKKGSFSNFSTKFTLSYLPPSAPDEARHAWQALVLPCALRLDHRTRAHRNQQQRRRRLFLARGEKRTMIARQ